MAQTQLQQLLKLPVLVEHFLEHRAETADMSFTEFIVLHYFSGNPVDDDYDRDQQLPFRSNDVVMVSGIVLMPEQLIPDFTPPVYQSEYYSLLSVSHLSSRHSDGVWQPPKSA